MINQEHLALGTAALRSGAYKQGRSTLRRGNEYCCLGVLTEVAIENGLELDTWREPGGFFTYGDKHEGAVLPKAVYEWYGFTSDNPKLIGDTSCINANDGECWTFTQIADAIDATYGPQAPATEVRSDSAAV